MCVYLKANALFDQQAGTVIDKVGIPWGSVAPPPFHQNRISAGPLMSYNNSIN